MIVRVIFLLTLMFGAQATGTLSNDLRPKPSKSAFNTYHKQAVDTTSKKIVWYQYIGRVFWRAGNYRGYYRLLQDLNNVQVSDPKELEEKNRLQRKLNGRFEKISSNFRMREISDPNIRAVTDALITKGYPEAKQLARSLTGHIEIVCDDAKALVVSIALIKFDGLMNKPKVPLWEFFWSLSLDSKLVILDFAFRMINNKDLVPAANVSKAQAVRARMRLIMKEKDIEKMLGIPDIASDLIEQNQLRGYASLVKGDYCGAIRHFQKAMSTASDAAAQEISQKIEGWTPKCKDKSFDQTFTAFCQAGKRTEFPISAALVKEANSEAIFNLERLFWTVLWAGDSRVASDILSKLKSAISPSLLSAHPIISNRLSYMEKEIGKCNAEGRNKNAFQSPEGQIVLKALESNQAVEASRLASNDQLRFASLIFLYPKAAYSPCMGGTMLTGVLADDLALLDLVDKVNKKQGLQQCPCADYNCLYRQLQAYYIGGSLEDVRRIALLISTSDLHCHPTVQILACLELCTGQNKPAQLRKALEHIAKINDGSPSQPNMNIAKDLADKLITQPLQKAKSDVDELLKPELERVKAVHANDTKPTTHAPVPPTVAPTQGPQVPMPSVEPAKPKLGSCTQGPQTCPCQAQPAPTPAQVAGPCPCQAQPVPIPCNAQPAYHPCPPPPPPSPCPCNKIPINPKTKQPYTPQDVQKAIDEDKEKRRKEAEPIARELNKEFVKKKCERDENSIKEKVAQIEKVLMHCPECDRIKQEEAAKVLAAGKTNVTSNAVPLPSGSPSVGPAFKPSGTPAAANPTGISVVAKTSGTPEAKAVEKNPEEPKEEAAKEDAPKEEPKTE